MSFKQFKKSLHSLSRIGTTAPPVLVVRSKNSLFPSDDMTSTESTSREVFLLPLTDTGAPDVPGEYIYLPPPTEPAYVLRIAIEGTSSICRQGSLWINMPQAGHAFERSKYRQFKYDHLLLDS